jgi:damage-control phosphatase, subfamily I
MFIWSDCIPCTLRMSMETARLIMKNEEQVRSFMKDILLLKPLRGENWQIISPEVVKEVLLKLQAITGETDPFKSIKIEQNMAALRMFSSVKEVVLKSRDPFLDALKFAVAGNALDAMIGAKEDPEKNIVNKLDSFIIDLENVHELKKRLSKTKKLIYVSDNCGEIVFDKLFLETIHGLYDFDVTFITRTVPVLNDAVLGDAQAVGMGDVAHLIENGIFEPFPGTLLRKVAPEVRKLIEGSDFIISKGVGNYDSLTEEESLKGKISFLFHAKCHPCCKTHKVPLGALIVYNT